MTPPLTMPATTFVQADFAEESFWAAIRVGGREAAYLRFLGVPRFLSDELAELMRGVLPASFDRAVNARGRPRRPTAPPLTPGCPLTSTTCGGVAAGASPKYPCAPVRPTWSRISARSYARTRLERVLLRATPHLLRPMTVLRPLGRLSARTATATPRNTCDILFRRLRVRADRQDRLQVRRATSRHEGVALLRLAAGCHVGEV